MRIRDCDSWHQLRKESLTTSHRRQSTSSFFLRPFLSSAIFVLIHPRVCKVNQYVTRHDGDHGVRRVSGLRDDVVAGDSKKQISSPALVSRSLISCSPAKQNLV